MDYKKALDHVMAILQKYYSTYIGLSKLYEDINDELATKKYKERAIALKDVIKVIDEHLDSMKKKS